MVLRRIGQERLKEVARPYPPLLEHFSSSPELLNLRNNVKNKHHGISRGVSYLFFVTKFHIHNRDTMPSN